MSDRDAFIDEVTEEVRRDRMFSLWRRYGPYVIGAIVAIVAAAGVKTWFDQQAEIEAQRVGAALAAAADTAPTEAAAALETLADQTGSEGGAVLARLLAAGVLASEGKLGQAAAAYDKVAEDGAAEPLLRDFADFRAAMSRAPGLDPTARANLFQPIASGNGPFRLLAAEAEAMARLEAGERDTAISGLRAVLDDAAAPAGLRRRVEAVLTAIGVSPDATTEG